MRLRLLVITGGNSRASQLPVSLKLEFRLLELGLSLVQFRLGLFDLLLAETALQLQVTLLGRGQTGDRLGHLRLVTGAFQYGQYVAPLEAFAFFDE